MVGSQIKIRGGGKRHMLLSISCGPIKHKKRHSFHNAGILLKRAPRPPAHKVWSRPVTTAGIAKMAALGAGRRDQEVNHHSLEAVQRVSKVAHDVQLVGRSGRPRAPNSRRAQRVPALVTKSFVGVMHTNCPHDADAPSGASGASSGSWAARGSEERAEPWLFPLA